MNTKVINLDREEETLKSVPWGPLKDKLKSLTGVELDLDISISSTGANSYVRLRSQNLASLVGVNNLFKDLHITNFGGTIDAEEGVFYIPVNFSWNYAIGGGGNGSCLGSAIYYMQEKKWKFNF